MRKISVASHPLAKATWMYLSVFLMLTVIISTIHFGRRLDSLFGSILIGLGSIWIIGYEAARVLLIAIAYHNEQDGLSCFWQAIKIRLLTLATLIIALYLISLCRRPVESWHYVGLSVSSILTILCVICNLILLSKIFQDN